MYTRYGMQGITWVEPMVALLVTLLVVLVFVWPMMQHNDGREDARLTTCLSQVRQLSVATQMYCQDNNGAFPDLHWARELSEYVGNNASLFNCPSDDSAHSANMISYGYSGLLIRADGSGVKEKDIASPTEVGVLCDAAPSRLFPDGGLIGGGGLLPKSTLVTPMPRHSHGTVLGYADGHALYAPNVYNPKDISGGITSAFDMANALRLVNNPAGGISDFPASVTSPASVGVGGEPCTRALLLAAADVWHVRAKAAIEQQGFHGQYAVQHRGTSYLWGIGDGKQPAGHAVPIARDLVLVITAKMSKIPSDFLLPDFGYQVSVWNVSMVRKAFTLGFRRHSLQAYTFDTDSGTRRFFTAHLGMHGHPLSFGPHTIIVKDDYEMVQQVADDPYGIGYCSSAAADPSIVQIIGLRTSDGKVYLYPQDNPKSSIMPATPPDWPLSRTLYAEYGGNAWSGAGTGIANVMLAPEAPGTQALRAGPLFRASFWTPGEP